MSLLERIWEKNEQKNQIIEYFQGRDFKVDLYNTCVENGIIKIENEYEKAKAFEYAKSLSPKVEEQDRQKVREWFEEGKLQNENVKMEKAIAERKEEERIERLIAEKTPIKVDLNSKWNEYFISNNLIIREITSSKFDAHSKRKRMLISELDSIGKKIEEAEYLTGGTGYLWNNKYEKKKNWVARGAAATAIAGPAAGAVFAGKAIMDNRDIAARNAAKVTASHFSYSDDQLLRHYYATHHLYESKNKCEEEIVETDRKIVMGQLTN